MLPVVPVGVDVGRSLVVVAVVVILDGVLFVGGGDVEVSTVVVGAFGAPDGVI